MFDQGKSIFYLVNRFEKNFPKANISQNNQQTINWRHNKNSPNSSSECNFPPAFVNAINNAIVHAPRSVSAQEQEKICRTLFFFFNEK